MKPLSKPFINLPPEQEAIRAKCFHPSGTFVEFPIEDVETSIPERFEKIVRMYPENTAIKLGERAVTYAELNGITNRIARFILARGRKDDTPVALLFQKGAEQIAAMIGVLKTGRFFALLDSSLPEARLDSILEDCAPEMMITDRQNFSLALELTGKALPVMRVDDIVPDISTDNLDVTISPDALACILHTSGSTGRPKGVMCNHTTLLHYVMLRTNADGYCPMDRIAHLTSGTTNAITNALFILLNGAALMPFDVNNIGTLQLSRWLMEQRITYCPIAAPLFRSLCEGLSDTDRFPDLRLLKLRSETVRRSDVELYKRFFAKYSVLSNGLSLSETQLLTEYFIDGNTNLPSDEVPVGYAVQDKEIVLLDEQGERVGYNEIGEIAVRSKYLSPGYWRNPELTAAKFRNDPQHGSKRLYFTGDLGLILPDGCLIHKGRKDFRVKVRGYGVETAEVERVLNAHSAVGQGVVVAQTKGAGESRLVAYYTSSKLPAPTVTEIRSFLSAQLPDFMIPSAFVMVEAIPLTPGGKVDRHALPAPDNVRPELVTAYLPPRNEVEEKLVAICEGVLDVRPIGVNDGFFDLGGDSLSAGRVISQVIKHFRLEIPLQSLFQSPTIAEMAFVIAQQQGELSRNEKLDHVTGPPLVSGSHQEQRPLSYSQQRLWFLDQLDPGGVTYNLFYAHQLKGELNVAALEQSFNEIIRRHQVLRTVFKTEDGCPQQIVLPTPKITIPVLDLRRMASKKDRWTEVHRMAKEEARRPFDLAIGPLLRIALLQLADDEYVFFRAMHHVVYDGWSESVLFCELATLYEDFSKEQRPPLADLPLQYADYAVWQRQWFQGEILESQLAYWKKQLENIPTLELPTDRPRPAVQSSNGARQYFTLSSTLSSELKSLSRRQGVTVFMTLLAAFQTLLCRYSGQTDIAIGTPVAGRSRREFEDLIGFFLNMLVQRLDLSGNPVFTEALGRVREMCLGALSHQELPFEHLVQELQPERSLSYSPLFQMMFVFQNTPRFVPQLSGIRVKQVEAETGIARFDLYCFMEEEDGRFKGAFSYNTDLFNTDTIERMVGHFRTLLEGIVTDPDQRISELPILTEAEKHQLLTEWNDTKAHYPRNKCIHELFEEQVEKTPDGVAVVFEDQQLTYKELNRRANQLAHYLRKLGVGPESLVAICLERSIEMIVGLLGILKAGGAYVPLDPSYPQERLGFILEDTQAGVLLTQKSSIEGRRWRIEDSDPRSSIPNARLNVVFLDSDLEAIGQESIENLSAAVSPDNLAYVIYTSGSTGKPKGVEITHGSAAAFLSWVSAVFSATEMSGVLASTSICFDLSVFEIFSPLNYGGRIILVQNALALASLSAASGVTLINTVPSAINELLRMKAIPPSICTVNLAGEPLKSALVRDIYDSTLVRKVYDLYGPSEDTTYSTFALRKADGPETIGKPTANTEIYILDANLAPVPIGIAGELYIGGDGLARGYLNRPELTAEKFIPSPFSDEPGDRLYRTGDLARYLPDGNIEFLGRIDNQVKIRGFRIELGEIESVLVQHPGVRESVALVREEESGDRRLVAYVVLCDQNASSTAELREFLKQKLPDYMVPSAFVLLDVLPLTPNGKVDRKALPEPDPMRPELRGSFVGSRTPIEEIIAEIWAEVLKVEKVGIHDNFFELGGHSLLATQVVSRVRRIFQVEIPLRSLFEQPTVAGLAGQIPEIQARTVGTGEMTDLLAELESMSDEEVQRHMDRFNSSSNKM